VTTLTPSRAAGAIGLRPWTQADAEELAAVYARAHDELAADAPWRTNDWFTAAGQRRRIRRCEDDPAVAGFVIVADGAVAGHLTLDEIRRDILQSAAIGYWVAPWQRGRGLATRAIGLAVEHAWERLGLHRLHATVDVDNRRSWRALENNGFHRVGTLSGFALVGGRWRDHHLYQLTADDRRGAPPASPGG
jgi:ribosomal-protein-alanine N-acetyltransferase